ncbi:MAG: acyltransferase [Chloroflexota bacterium]|nr:acyltransferase [Chloroflexota bacterium]
MAILRHSYSIALSTQESAKATTTPVTPKPTQRLDFLDGLRAFASIAVLFMHALQMQGYGTDRFGITPILPLGDGVIGDMIRFLYDDIFLRVGPWGVKLFVVLSGFSLMLGVARSQDEQIRGGVQGYFKRRIWRIWPPYYIALIIAIILILLVPGLNIKRGVYNDANIPITWDSVVAHALFIHTLSPHWAESINDSQWTLGVEEQIYLLFPLFLLPLWRRFGSVNMVIITTALTLLLVAFIPFHNYEALHPWYLAMWSIGAMGASIAFSRRPNEIRWREQVPWLALAIGAFAVWQGAKVLVRLLVPSFDPYAFNLDPLTDLIFAVGCMALFIHLTQVWRRGVLPRWSLINLLSSPILGAYGRFTFSVYLTHVPFLCLFTVILHSQGLVGDVFYPWLLLVGVPLTLLWAYIFHLIVERPFMSDTQKVANKYKMQTT